MLKWEHGAYRLEKSGEGGPQEDTLTGNTTQGIGENGEGIEELLDNYGR